MVGGAGNDTLVAGSGSSTLVGGSGADNFVFFHSVLAGHSVADIITDFSTTQDGVILSGYSATEASHAIATASSIGGSTTLTLSDNTQITFLGISSASNLTGRIISG